MIIGLMKQRISEADKNNIASKLSNLSDIIVTKASEHLKRVLVVLTEFDLHDESHSIKVVQNIEELIGNNELQKLSTYELFLLQTSAYLHDCAMAPSEWEIKLLEKTEGTEKYYIDKDSFKNDLKQPFTIAKATEVIQNFQPCIFQPDWWFGPSNEADWYTELSELLVEYQEFRNGFKRYFEQIKSDDDFEKLNKAMRIEFIRKNHHIRIERYIKNMTRLFEQHLSPVISGKHVAIDLAVICRSHGESLSFVEKLKTNTRYFGTDNVNLQFVAMMLRLGDIIHYSFDRAPVAISSTKQFESDYSYQQWAVKNNGVNYGIANNEISFQAFCETPHHYFMLQDYIDWIDDELQNYHRLRRHWSDLYKNDLPEKVNRESIEYDSDIFTPKIGMKFRLDQRKIIELLMGVGLYKDKYACLRELYQNSLDACKCLQERLKAEGRSSDCSVEFGLEKRDSKTFLYCKDNGIGMSEYVIENFLLNIGNSYYKSADFFKKQAGWSGSFTPTSQFGIGILSCFMIGSQIEILTKESDKEIIACTIDGPHESFYYKTVTKSDRETIGQSGTIIKILLNEQVAAEIINGPADRIGLLFLNKANHEFFPEEYSLYREYYKRMKNNLFVYIQDFVKIPAPEIPVVIVDEYKNRVQIPESPIVFDHSKQGLSENDFDFINYSIRDIGWKEPMLLNYSDVFPQIKYYKITSEIKGVIFSTYLMLPKKGFPFCDDIRSLNILPQNYGHGFCIDGISISTNIGSRDEFEHLAMLEKSGVINYVGADRPQLSVDRTSITKWPELGRLYEDLLTEVYKSVISTVQDHISIENITVGSKEYNLIWLYIFSKFSTGSSVFIDKLSGTDFGNVHWPDIQLLTDNDMSIRNFINSPQLTIARPNNNPLNHISQVLLKGKLLSAKNIAVNNNHIEVTTENFYQTAQFKWSDDPFYLDLICADIWTQEQLNDYDIISELLPVIPMRLWEAITSDETVVTIHKRVHRIHGYSNGIGAFFSQDPLLLKEDLGMFHLDSGFGRRKKTVYNFEKKRGNFGLYEINSRFGCKEKNVLFVFINPRDLTPEEETEFAQYQVKDTNYVKGVKEGWSILFTGMPKENTIIRAGIQTRNSMVSLISDEFWEEYADYTFKFLDGVQMMKAEN